MQPPRTLRLIVAITLPAAMACASSSTVRTADAGNLLASQAISTQNSTDSSSGASLGVGFSLGSKSGVTINASANQAQGSGNGTDTTYTNTQVKANTAVITSGGDTSVKGGVVTANSINASVGGNLNVTSLQDTSVSTSQSSSAGVGASLCLPPLCYGASSATVSAGKANSNSNYASVTEQSGLKAGDGGFNVTVAGNTTLTGGAITSTDKAIADNKNSFSTGGSLSSSDIQNSANFDASGFNISAGVSGKLGDQTSTTAQQNMLDKGYTAKEIADGLNTTSKPSGSAGFGQAGGSAASTTQSGISGVAGNKDVRTTDTSTGIQKIFDQDKVNKDVQAQITITATAGQVIPKAAADFSDKQAKSLRDAGKTEEAKKWEEGGAYRVAMHTGFGLLTGDLSGAVAAGGIAGAAKTIDQLQNDVQTALVNAGVDPGVAQMAGQALGQTAALTTGAAIGAATSGSASSTLVGAGTAFNVDTNNRQLHPTEKKIIRDEIAKQMAKDMGISEEQATKRLEAQLLRQVDANSAQSGSSDQSAALYLNSYKSTHQGLSVGGDQWGNAVPLFGAVGYQRQDSSIFSATPQTTTPPPSLGFGQVGDYIKGIGKGVVEGAANVGSAILHPVDIINNFVDAVTDPMGTGQKIQKKAGSVINDAQSGNMKPAGELLGEDIGGSVASTALGLVVGKAVSVVKATKVELPASSTAALQNNFYRDGSIVDIGEHFGRFENGASLLAPSESIGKYPYIGRLDGLFVTSPQYMNSLIESTGGNSSLIKVRLGIEPQYWNGSLTRVDIPFALNFSPRLPSGLEVGANPKFIPGGFTSGGAPEIVINPVKLTDVKTTPVLPVVKTMPVQSVKPLSPFAP